MTVSFVTLLVHIFALSSVLWVYSDMYFFGLWVICVEKVCTSFGMRAPGKLVPLPVQEQKNHRSFVVNGGSQPGERDPQGG